MSNGNPHRYSASTEPHATISAQQVVQDQPERYGFLRKRGQKERMLENLHLSRHINWRQRFVAIKDGCCYCYSDEISRSPLQTFSLQGYNRIFRSQSDRAAYVFTVEPEPNCRKKVHTFAATTDSDRIEWMQKFREAISTANDLQPTPLRSSLTEPDDIYVELEKPVYEPKVVIRSQRLDDSYEEEYDEEEEESSDDSDYDRPDDIVPPASKPSSRRNVPLPPVPQESSNGASSSAKRPAAPLPRPKPSSPESSGDGSFSPRSKAASDPRFRPVLPMPSSHEDSPHSVESRPKPRPPLPTPAPKSSQQASTLAPSSRPKPPVPVPASGKPPPPTKTRRLSEKDSFIDDSDREAAIGILKDCNSPGTFLIRKSRQGDTKVLVVMTPDDVKEYKIFTDPENGQASLDKKSFFDTVDDLLEHYNKHSLPNRQQTLTRSYSSVSSKR